MSRTTTRTVNVATFADRPGASTVIKLMMACNDLSLANDAQGVWKSEQSPTRKSRAKGAGMYFVRLQVSHLNEALKIIRELRDDPSLMKLVDQCDAQSRASFTKLEQFMPGGAQHGQFGKVAGRIRQNLGFHYDESGKLIAKALKDRVAKHCTSPSSVTRGSTAHLWHFELADEILDRIVVREIWKIPEPADLRTEADKTAMWIHDILLAFIDFCGEFIWKYVGR
ncbi:MAG: hypothetical protein WAL71_08380 [Terriglobales bacterium]